MKGSVRFTLAVLLSVALLGCARVGMDEAAVAAVVEQFGRKLQTVSLRAPREVLQKSMQENYGDLVAPALLAAWLRDPLQAPGRLTSSPWPDRIEIQRLDKVADGVYRVHGEIMEITSVEKVSGGVAAKRPITLVVERTGQRWLITAVTLGAYDGGVNGGGASGGDGTNGGGNGTVYSNNEFGFRFSLPASWQGYQIVTGQWEGSAIAGPQSGETAATGPIISIRHPDWTPEQRRQDIPILVFTRARWQALHEGEFHIGAAPVGPSELGRNSRYVFALPARYNYAFPPGFEEVAEILAGSPLQAIEPDG